MIGTRLFQVNVDSRQMKLAGLTAIPAYIRVANDQGMLEMALVENIQRQDLNALEVAISYKRLLEECALTQEELSSRVGKNRITVTNFLRLLRLPPEIQASIRDGKLSMGHARAILGVENIDRQLALYHEIMNNNWVFGKWRIWPVNMEINPLCAKGRTEEESAFVWIY